MLLQCLYEFCWVKFCEEGTGTQLHGLNLTVLCEQGGMSWLGPNLIQKWQKEGCSQPKWSQPLSSKRLASIYHPMYTPMQSCTSTAWFILEGRKVLTLLSNIFSSKEKDLMPEQYIRHLLSLFQLSLLELQGSYI